MEITLVKIGKVKPNPENPRVIKDDAYRKLVKSVQDFPEMLQVRPIVVNQDMVVLGGNMRLKACMEAGIKQIPIIVAHGLTEEQQKEFMIKDNASFGEWDWDMLANEWDMPALSEWGINLPVLTTSYEPDLMPSIDTSSVTAEMVESRARELAQQMVHEIRKQDTICPSCGHEFQLSL
jgi:ParB-like chromosome segregation protein Spo0J